MSLVLIFIYWVAIPVFALLAARWLLRRAMTPFHKGLIVAVSVTVFLGWFWLVVGQKLWLNHQVRELCAKDGGVKVYETVTLPPEKFNQWGQPNFFDPTQGENALGSEYIFKRESPDFQNRNSTVFRYHYVVIRRLDQKILGETTSYGRSGGDLPGPWYGSSFHCPDSNKAGEMALFMGIFISSNRSEK